MLFPYLKENEFKSLIISGYTKEWLEYLRPIFHKNAKKHNIEIFDTNKIEF